MKVHAIRVAEFGRFKAPVALEALSGGLDILIGPNEAGKSTLFKALRLALFAKHRTAHRELISLSPYGGGAPLVEVEFELCGEPWRLRKRFLSGHAAELVSLKSGDLARGNDAEEKLQRLLVEGGVAGGRELLWPEQGELLMPVIPGRSEAPGADVLRIAIDREIAAAAGGRAVRRVRDAVRAELGKFITDKQKRPRGTFQAALGVAEQTTFAFERARAEFEAAEGLLERLATLEMERAKRTSPAVQAALQTQLSESEDQLRSARRYIEERDAARLVLAEARAAYEAASGVAKGIADGLAELETLEAAAREHARQESEITHRLAAAEAEVERAEEARLVARACLDAAAAGLKRATAIARWQELSARVERARVADARMRELKERLRGLPLGEGPIRQARGLAARIAENTARLESASAAVTVSYDAGAARRIRVAGNEIADGERLLALTTLVLDIPGVGRVEIEPGASRDRDQIEMALARDRSTLQELLREAAVTDVAALEAGHELARSLAAELETVSARAEAIAPEGLADLEMALSAAAGEIDSGFEHGGDVADPKALALAVDAARLRLQGVDECCRKSIAGRDALEQQVTVLKARAEERQARFAALAASLPPRDERAARLAQVMAAAHRASTDLDDALRLERLAAERAPDQDGMKHLEEQVVRARQASEELKQAISSFEKEKARIEGELEAARREDIATRVADLEGEVERALSVRDHLAEEVRALQLLEAELGAEDERLRDSYLAPVTARLGPYIEAVFPDAALTLGNSYAVEALRRGIQVEALDRLSDGTREQIAVLVRLAFARLLADQGLEIPLVLDDALVYSDDHRIAAMHRALEMAAVSHQVIVLSCREQSFRGLRGNRVELVPWQAKPF